MVELRQRSTARQRLSMQVRDLRRDDVPQVTSMLSVLPTLYPNGDAWLSRRLADVLVGDARCTLLDVGHQLAGVAIESPKAAGRLKLSTFLIADEFRNAGMGGAFIRHLKDRWVAEELAEVYVTVADQNHDQVLRAFNPVGFLTLTCEKDRYGAGRREYVLTCLPSENDCR